MNITIGKRALSRIATQAASQTTTKSVSYVVPPNLIAVWQGAFSIWVTHAPAMLISACIGATSFIIIREFITSTVMQIVIGLLTASLARGMTTWLALQGERQAASLTAASRATFRHLPALLVSSLIYGLLITAGWAGLSTWLRGLHINVPLFWYLHHQKMTLDVLSQESLMHTVNAGVIQTTNAFIPDPGAPFTIWLPNLRATTFTVERVAGIDSQGSSGLLLNYGAHNVASLYPPSTVIYTLLTGGGLALIVCAETLLRFRTITALQLLPKGQSVWIRWLVPIANSISLGRRYFGIITLHIWCVRLLLGMVSVVFVIVPSVLVQHIVLPKLLLLTHWPGWPWLQQNSAGLHMLVVALVSLFYTTFNAAYDAQLYSQITRFDTVSHPVAGFETGG